MSQLFLLLTLAAAPTAVSAEVLAKAPTGFHVRQTAEVKASPETVWTALGQIERWWNPAHTYSGAAKNLSMPLKAGGCFCETLANGGVVHATIVQVRERQHLGLTGGLGPLQFEGANASWRFELKPSGAGTQLTHILNVGGWSPGGLDQLAAPVDAVMSEQFARLVRYAESGSAEPAR